MQVEGDSKLQILGTLLVSEDFIELRAQVLRGLALYGIEVAYFVAPLTRDARVEPVFFKLNMSDVFQRHYRAHLHQFDPLPILSTQFSNAFYWPDDLPSEQVTAKQQRYLQIAAKHGLARGIGVACYGPQGRTGFLGAGWSENESPNDDTKLALHHFAQTAFQRYCQLYSKGYEVPSLSDRELEVLGWMCSGKSNPAMADIIGVSRSSIDAYIRRIFAKLSVTDRTAACVRAHSLGLVASEDLVNLVAEAHRHDEPSH